ncbi:MAG: gliding motility-associated ABC transporter ATP-binding subunit GldA [Bacteroidia bacterium]
MSIKVEHLTKTYGEQNALDDVSFSVKSGEIVGFLGPNGAGKSTTMKILTSYIPPTSGYAEVCSIDVMTDSIEVRKKIGYLPEHNPLYLDMYVREYLEFVAGIHKLDNIKQRVDTMIDTVGLQIERKKKIGTLSKGYRQRVGLAQALIHEPEVLILDEPTSGLDPNQLEEIRGLIKKLGKEKTVILSTHIMQEVEAICDRVLIINHGKIVADDDASTLKLNTSNKVTIKVEFDTEISIQKLKVINSVTNVKSISSTAFVVEASTKDDIRKVLSKLAQEEGALILEMTREQESLENVFKRLTKK